MVDIEVSRTAELECLLTVENIAWMEWLSSGEKYCVLDRSRNIFVSGLMMATPINLHNNQKI